MFLRFLMIRLHGKIFCLESDPEEDFDCFASSSIGQSHSAVCLSSLFAHASGMLCQDEILKRRIDSLSQGHSYICLKLHCFSRVTRCFSFLSPSGWGGSAIYLTEPLRALGKIR